MATLLVFTAGVLLWVTYGFLLGSMPIVAANGATLTLVAALLVAKAKFG